MSSGPNPIVIRISDGVDPAIITKLDTIGQSAKTAQTGINGLQTALQQVNSQGLSGLQSTLRSISTSSQTLARATTSMGQAAFSAASGIRQLTTAYTGLNAAMLAALGTLQAFTAAAATANNGV